MTKLPAGAGSPDELERVWKEPGGNSGESGRVGGSPEESE